MNRKLSFISTAFLLLLFLCLSIPSFAKGPEKESTGQNFLYKTSALDPNRTLSNINNWSYWMYFDGNAGIDPDGNSGGVYPRGTAGAIYEDGLVWGAKVNGNIRVGGQTYRVGTRGVLSRIYRIRSDWKTLTGDAIKEDAAEFNRVTISSVTEAQTDAIIEQYQKDWAEWPVADGAPYVDANDNGIYDPVLDADGMPDANAGDYPGIASADQVIFFVADDSDAGRVSNLYGSDPMGIEMQVTTWAYNQRSATLGQLIFKKYKIINISSDTFNDMYVAQWCDPDLGSSSDDLVGCDSTLSIGFAYNGGPSDSNFDPFGIAPPAVGYDFFQGPVVDGVAGQDVNGNGVDDAVDYAVFDLKEVGPGKINLPMTSFAYFSAGNTEWDDPDLGEYNGSLQWYNLLRGNISNTFVDAPTSFTHRNAADGSGPATNFPLNGDPVEGTGDVDGQGFNFSAADRRMSVNTGPFTMAPGDVQEVVVAIVGGHGEDYIDSVTKIKQNDDLAQKLYNDLFKTIPKAPPAPEVTFTAFEDQIVLNWGSNLEAVARTEETIYKDSDSTGYSFEGYNVYQLTFGLKAQSRLIATYDVKNGVTTINKSEFLSNLGVTTVTPQRFGTDSGVQRYFITDQDEIGGGQLLHGKNYFFAVTAYNYNPSPSLVEDLSLESSIIAIPVQTQAPKPGSKITVSSGDDVSLVHSAGTSDGQSSVTVIDPGKVTGHEYSVFFTEDADTNSDTYGQILWNVRDNTTGTVVVSNQVQSTSLDENSEQPLFDGLQVKVAGPPPDFKLFEVTANNAGPLVPSEMGAFAFNSNGFPLLYNDEYPEGTDRPATRQQTNGSTWGIHEDNYWMTDDTDASYELFVGDVGYYMGGINGGSAPGGDVHGIAVAVPFNFEIRFTAAGSKAYMRSNNQTPTRFLIDVPFELWNVGIDDDTADDYRMFPMIYDRDDNAAWNLLAVDHAVSGGANDPYMEGITWLDPTDKTPGEAGYNAILAAVAASDAATALTNFPYAYNSLYATAHFNFMAIVNWNGGDVTDPTFPANMDAVVPEQGTIFKITTSKPNALNDEFTFTAPSVQQSVALEEDALKKTSVFPNPYYAGHEDETNKFNRYVTFYPIAPKTTVRIFNLAGDHVVKLETPAGNTSQFLQWDLLNDSDLPVASGIYFAHVKMTLSDGSTKTKVLKFFIIQKRQQLKFF